MIFASPATGHNVLTHQCIFNHFKGAIFNCITFSCYRILAALGALYPDGTSDTLKNDDGVPPGGNFTYTWTVKPDYAPQKGDANCLTWAYHSHVSASQDISSGLIGALLTCKKGKADILIFLLIPCKTSPIFLWKFSPEIELPVIFLHFILNTAKAF